MSYEYLDGAVVGFLLVAAFWAGLYLRRWMMDHFL
jgi:hypothetical protein